MNRRLSVSSKSLSKSLKGTLSSNYIVCVCTDITYFSNCPREWTNILESFGKVFQNARVSYSSPYPEILIMLPGFYLETEKKLLKT